MKKIGLVVALSMVGCGQTDQQQDTARKGSTVLTGFTAQVNPDNGTMTIATDVGSQQRGLTPVTVEQDTIAGSGSLNTVELVTNWTANDIDGFGQCGRVSTFCGDVTLRSFHTYTLNNVWSEITSITPVSGNEAQGDDTAPTGSGLSDTLGLWSYGTVIPTGNNNRLWIFGDTGMSYVVRGRVMADVLCVQAYDIPIGHAGCQGYGGVLGLDFDVIQPITVSQLGAFDDMSNGIIGTTIQVVIFSRTTQTHVTPVLSFTGSTPGTLHGGYWYQPLPAPIILPPGQYSVVAVGYHAGERNGNTSCQGGAQNSDNGAINFVGGGRYSGSPLITTYPTTIDGGPTYRYKAGTFAYTTGFECAP